MVMGSENQALYYHSCVGYTKFQARLVCYEPPILYAVVFCVCTSCTEIVAVYSGEMVNDVVTGVGIPFRFSCSCIYSSICQVTISLHSEVVTFFSENPAIFASLQMH